MILLKKMNMILDELQYLQREICTFSNIWNLKKMKKYADNFQLFLHGIRFFIIKIFSASLQKFVRWGQSPNGKNWC